MWITIVVLTIVVLVEWWCLRISLQAVKDGIKMMDALKKIYKAEPDWFHSPENYPQDCQKAVKEMAKIAKDCLWDICKQDHIADASKKV